MQACKEQSDSLVEWRRNWKPHMRAEGLPLFYSSRVLGELCGAVQRFLRLGQIVEREVAKPETCPRVPLLRILPRHALKDGQHLAASALLHQCQGRLHFGVL